MLAGVNVFLVYLWPSEGLKQIKANGLILFTYVKQGSEKRMTIKYAYFFS